MNSASSVCFCLVKLNLGGEQGKSINVIFLACFNKYG